MPSYLRFAKGVIDSSDLLAERQPRTAAGEPGDVRDPRRV